MLHATLVLSSRNWGGVALLFLAGIGLILAWSYRRASGAWSVRAGCAALKSAGLLLLCWCLLEPVWVGERAKPGANTFLLLADNSQGMTIKDAGTEQSRGELLKSRLADPSLKWTSLLADHFQLRRYFFDSRLQSTADFGELNFQGRSSAIVGALKSLGERSRGQSVAGILLFTDGNATDLPAGSALDLAGLPPIYTVLCGKEEGLKDLSVAKVTTTQTTFEDAPVTIEADIAALGCAGEKIVTQLLDEKNVVVAEQAEKVSKENDALKFRFQIRPARKGINFYKIKTSLAGEGGAGNTREATLANNVRLVAVDRGDAPRRVLYVAGRPNWEFKFFNRALSEEERIQLVALIRVAKREPKFDFRGRPGESSNPLYRGFDKVDDQTERYDQPVLVRLNTKDQLELKGGFPKTAEELFAYDAVVIDDLEAEFFTRDQMALLQKFVSERGGGFLMLGGAETFEEGKYAHTPVADVLPVYLGHPAPRPPSSNLVLSLTREGWLQPWARLRTTETEEKERLGSMPPFQVLNATSQSKPGASVIATLKDATGAEFPALVVQRYGNGRAAALTIGDMWRWGLKNESTHKDMDKAWRQLVRWLIVDVPQAVDLQLYPSPEESDAIAVQVRVRDKKFQALDNATIRLSVQGQKAVNEGFVTNAQVLKLNAEASAKEPGLYEAVFVPREIGGYKFDVIALDGSGAEIGRAAAGWPADPVADEFKSLKPNRAFAEALARQTKGEVLSLDDLVAFAKRAPTRRAPVTETWSQPLWHSPWILLLAIACFAGEWGWRRWKGLA